ncbi:MAG: ATP-grasp domain-containing protein [Bryobacteraceae bacterium]|nr:ATP-grasp domain-containing protein [Bryobacteraceae bacterium]MDW8379184.1 ATP-grasp domain-containing protein [Bryobacterales bacterium]
MCSAPTILCLASYEKGHDFLREAKRQGARLLLLTSLSLKEKARWPKESIDEIFYMPDDDKRWNQADTIRAVSYLARTQFIDLLVPLDDFDLEMAAALREHLRIPGMGQTTTRYFRDKLAMRMQALEKGLNVPDFVHVLNYRKIQEFLDRVPPPWVLKPRLSAGAMGIKLAHSQEEFWNFVNRLGDEQSYYLVERYVPGDVYHVDTIVYEREILFAVASRYGHPPLDVSHKGGVFTTSLLERGSEEEQSLLAKNRMVLQAMGMVRGVSHTEFIRSRHDGRVYFLETSARVGGAHIAELIEAATGVNLWAEWAKLELARGKQPYSVKPLREEYAGLLVSLARQEHPDTSAYDDPEVVWRMSKRHHVGMIVRSPSYARVQDLLASYAQRVRVDFMATQPPRDRPAD